MMTNDLFLEPNSHTSEIKSRLNTANKNAAVDQWFIKWNRTRDCNVVCVSVFVDVRLVLFVKTEQEPVGCSSL